VGGVIDSILKPVRINIAEDDDWKKHYDLAEKGMEWTLDQAWEEYSNTSVENLAELVMNLAEKALSKRDYKKFSTEDAEDLCRAMKKDRNEFESIHQAILDAMGWAWEVAAIPTDSDIRGAMGVAEEEFLPYGLGEWWNLISSEKAPVRGVKEWRPGPGPIWLTHKEVYKQLTDQINYERKENHYDRFLVFTFGKAEAVQQLVSAAKNLPDDERDELLDDLDRELDAAEGAFVSDFFKALNKSMEGIDLYNRVNFDRQWKSVLEDRSRLKSVREEIQAFMAKPREEREED
jgi:hypothetical protein